MIDARTFQARTEETPGCRSSHSLKDGIQPSLADTRGKSRSTEAQILGILKLAEGGGKVTDVAREHGLSPATTWSWRARFGGMEVSEAKRLEDENRRPKQMVADLSLDQEALTPAPGRSGEPCSQARRGRALQDGPRRQWAPIP